MSYADDAEVLVGELAVWYLGIEDPTYPVRHLGKLSQDLAQKFRALAIMQLLSEASTDLFLHNLMRAGRVRVAYLSRLAKEGISDDFFQGAGRYGSLFSSIAASDWAIAAEIASLSPTDIVPGEYEDDACVAWIVGLLVKDAGAGEEAFEGLFKRFRAYLELAPDARLEVLDAIVRRDQGAFDAAFPGVIAAFESDIRKAKQRRQLEEPVTLALREVSVDGLAYLRLAERRGLTTMGEYPYCPSLARAPMRVPFREV